VLSARGGSGVVSTRDAGGCLSLSSAGAVSINAAAAAVVAAAGPDPGERQRRDAAG
jgi:hypothetical protein